MLVVNWPITFQFQSNVTVYQATKYAYIKWIPLGFGGNLPIYMLFIIQLCIFVMNARKYVVYHS